MQVCEHPTSPPAPAVSPLRRHPAPLRPLQRRPYSIACSMHRSSHYPRWSGRDSPLHGARICHRACHGKSPGHPGHIWPPRTWSGLVLTGTGLRAPTGASPSARDHSGRAHRLRPLARPQVLRRNRPGTALEAATLLGGGLQASTARALALDGTVRATATVRPAGDQLEGGSRSVPPATRSTDRRRRHPRWGHSRAFAYLSGVPPELR